MLYKKSLIVLGFCLATAGASAQTNGNINVSASVLAVCNIVTTDLSFGNYNPLSATPLQANSTLAVTCSQGSVPVISLGAGNNVSGAQRRMIQGTDLLNYGLYKPSTNLAAATCAYTASWGDGVGSWGTTLTTTAAPSLASRTYNVCGEIPIGQNAPVGSYADVVVATVSF